MRRPNRYIPARIPSSSFGLAVLLLAAMVAYGPAASACVGARPLGMGGAFIAVSDDHAAVYWNPAGLIRLAKPEFGFTYTVNNRDHFNYDHFASYVEPDSGTGAGGISWIYDRSLFAAGTGSSAPVYLKDNSFVYSYARSIAPGFAWGANLRYQTHTLEQDGEPITSASGWGLDLGFLYELSDKVTFGLLVQDVTGTTIRSDSSWYSASYSANIRPGVAVRPDDKTILALDLYDLGESSGPTLFNIGAERWVTPSVALRAGYYGFNFEGTDGALTLGAGLQRGQLRLDWVYLGGRLGSTHQLGVSWSF